jgi:hypothetical protein
VGLFHENRGVHEQFWPAKRYARITTVGLEVYGTDHTHPRSNRYAITSVGSDNNALDLNTYMRIIVRSIWIGRHTPHLAESGIPNLIQAIDHMIDGPHPVFHPRRAATVKRTPTWGRTRWSHQTEHGGWTRSPISHCYTKDWQRRTWRRWIYRGLGARASWPRDQATCRRSALSGEQLRGARSSIPLAGTTDGYALARCRPLTPPTTSGGGEWTGRHGGAPNLASLRFSLSPDPRQGQ